MNRFASVLLFMFAAHHLAEADAHFEEKPQETMSIAVGVFGTVKKPGTYQLKKGETVWDVILRAGGPNDDRELVHVRLTRTKNDGSLIVYTLDLRQKEKAADAMPVRDGDIVMLPERIP